MESNGWRPPQVPSLPTGHEPYLGKCPVATPGLLYPGLATLHYPGCGCPPGGARGERGQRLCDVADARIQEEHGRLVARLGPGPQAERAGRPLHVAFVLPHHGITGGMKMLCEQVRLLRRRGHRVAALFRTGAAAPGARAMPAWTDAEADAEVTLGPSQPMSAAYDWAQVDVVVVGIFHQIAEVMGSTQAPVLYWEQGHESLFGDPIRLTPVHNYLKQDQLFHLSMQLPAGLAAVSPAAATVLRQEFGREPVLVQNGIDCARFYPGPRSMLPPTRVYMAPNFLPPAAAPGAAPRPSVLLVGNPALALKNFETAVTVLSMVNRMLPIDVTWVAQKDPEPYVFVLPSSALRIKLHIDPPQDQLPELIRGHTCCLFTSVFEAWGMPVLEAMASGTPVVTSDCIGVRAFAANEVNCLIGDAKNAMELTQLVLAVVRSKEVGAALAAAGRATAERFTPEASVTQMEQALYAVTACAGDLVNLRLQCPQDLCTVAAWAAVACATTSAAPSNAAQPESTAEPPGGAAEPPAGAAEAPAGPAAQSK